MNLSIRLNDCFIKKLIDATRNDGIIIDMGRSRKNIDISLNHSVCFKGAADQSKIAFNHWTAIEVDSWTDGDDLTIYRFTGLQTEILPTNQLITL